MGIKRKIVIMSEVWNNVYNSDSSFFGEEPSNFALLCFNHMKVHNSMEEIQHFSYQMELKWSH
ncbi:MAG: hypothetical protein WAK17_10000 [Candidatus Nitrosopolaris sp.]